MNWIKIITSDGKKHIVNANSIMSVEYDEETDLSIIQFTRAAYGALYVRGNVVDNFIRSLTIYGDRIMRIGEPE